ncbi:MAG: cupredoxin domain-containing protein [Thaumarchaeota archaeon]|nr:cupredoxin domain-containing protein [Nitrososphaerota archaeon]MCL5317729.1 cupredoxin domain-containing protein [Nitrososphaerota archaeon]
MATRNTYIIAVILAIIVIVAISAFVLSGTPGTSPYYTTTGSTTTTNSSTSTSAYPTTTSTTNTSSTTTSTTSQGAAAKITLVAQNFKFNTTNPTITVKAGQQVTFTVVNKDSVSHTFDIQGASGGSTGQISPGQTGTLTVTLSAGTYKYQCAIHPGAMNGQIVAQ